ncbi:U-box domain-containing protein 33-like isoform X2 [Wolffia australiana]
MGTNYESSDLHLPLAALNFVSEISRTGSPSTGAEDKIFVAVGNKLKECKTVLAWALEQFPRSKKFVLVHVHCPDRLIPLMGGRFPASSVDPQHVSSYRQVERGKMEKTLRQYLDICANAKFQAETLVIEMDDVAKGLIALINEHRITLLIMGAASDKNYSRKMKSPRSKKAKAVLEQAPHWCRIQFVCKGKLVFDREGRLDDANASSTTPSASSTPSQLSSMREPWAESTQLVDLPEATPVTGLPWSTEGDYRVNGQPPPSAPWLTVDVPKASHLTNFPWSTNTQNRNNGLPPQSSSSPSQRSSTGKPWKDASQRADLVEVAPIPGHVRSTDPHYQVNGSPSQSSSKGSQHTSMGKSWKDMSQCVDLVEAAPMTRHLRSTVPDDQVNSSPSPSSFTPSHSSSMGEPWKYTSQRADHVEDSSLTGDVRSTEADDQVNGCPYPSRGRHENVGEVQEGLYNQLQEALLEAENARREAYEESCRRRKAEKDVLEATRRAISLANARETEAKQRREVEEKWAREREELQRLQVEKADALRKLIETQEQSKNLETQLANSEEESRALTKKLEEAKNLETQLANSEKESRALKKKLEEAHPLVSSLQRERQGSGLLGCPVFSFEELHKATCGFSPSLVVGSGGHGVVYRGFLHHTAVAVKRFRPTIANYQRDFHHQVEILTRVRHPNLVTLLGACPESSCLVYEFMSNGNLEDRLAYKDNSPPLSWQTRINVLADICSALIFLHSTQPHGNLKPANVLLDSSFKAKLSDFGLPGLTEPGLTALLDVYSLGLIILRLVTGRSQQGLIGDVKEALVKKTLHRLVDQNAGDWPFVQLTQLAHLGLQCCATELADRPDLVNGVWKIIGTMKISACASLSVPRHHLLGSGDDDVQAPSYLVCPIFQEVMRDPQVAADGFTYEGEAVRGWFEGGNHTSPMTNLVLPHQQLIPNHAIRSAIQEWLQCQK